MKMRDSLAVGILALGLSTAPALAQTAAISNNGGAQNSNFGGVQNSNYGGVNNSNPQGVPSFGGPGGSFSAGYNPTVLERARDLQQQLADAQSVQACTGIRSFLRTPQPCPTNERLIKAKADAIAFLESVKNPSPSLLAAPTTVLAKSSPTW